MKITKENLDKLKRDKYGSPEKKLQWLYSALVFGNVKKEIVKGRSR